jgi:hypothetical protein
VFKHGFLVVGLDDESVPRNRHPELPRYHAKYPSGSRS